MDNEHEANKVAKLWGEKAHEHIDGRNKLLSWDCHPLIVAYINRRITGNENERWLQFVKRKFCPRILNNGLSLGSGSGVLERDALNIGICKHFDAYDISPEAISIAKIESIKQGYAERINYICDDLNSIQLESNKYDICFAGASLHHLSNLEYVLDQVIYSLRSKGLLVMIEYVGPSRYQWSDKVELLMNKLLSVIPRVLCISLKDGKSIRGEVKRPSVEDVISVDPSEAIRSNEILTQVYRRFNVVYHANFGGTLLCFTLADIVGNFNENDPKDKAILELIVLFEETLIDENIIPSDFVFLVGTKPN